MTKNKWVGAGGVVLILVVGWILFRTNTTVLAPRVDTSLVATSTSDTAPVSQPVATSTVAATTVQPFPINKADTIASWSFDGPYAGNTTLTAQAHADITKLTGMLGKGEYDDYDLYNGIANDYASLGDGKSSYKYYYRAIAIHPTKGLAYENLADLMTDLGAYYTAADAYAKATAVEPGMLLYHTQRLTYLTQQFPKDTPRITQALIDASKQFGDNASILAIEAQWLTEQGRYADAIKAWQMVKTLSPGKDMSAVDAEIARLESK